MNSIWWNIFLLISQTWADIFGSCLPSPCDSKLLENVFCFHSPYIFNTESLLKPWQHWWENHHSIKVAKWPRNRKPRTTVPTADRSSVGSLGSILFGVLSLLLPGGDLPLPLPHNWHVSDPCLLLFPSTHFSEHPTSFHSYSYSVYSVPQLWLLSGTVPTAHSTFLPGRMHCPRLGSWWRH